VFINQPKNAIYKIIAAKIAQRTQIRSAFSKMRIAIGIAPWTMKRALPSYFNGEHGDSAGKNFSPGLKHV
jgi:hypothetical protein